MSEETPIEKLHQATIESIKELKSMSGFDLLDETLKFRNKIHDLIESQKLPSVLIVGCLMDEIYELEFRGSKVAIDANFRRVINYIDKNFMKKEPMKEVTKK